MMLTRERLFAEDICFKGPNQPMLSKFPQTTIYGEKGNPTQKENEAKQPKCNLPMNWPKAREIDPNKLKNISTQKDTHIIIFSLIHRPYTFCCEKEGIRWLLFLERWKTMFCGSREEQTEKERWDSALRRGLQSKKKRVEYNRGTEDLGGGGREKGERRKRERKERTHQPQEESNIR